ncbi:hypothetical protein KIN20_010915 [Parelaphostrongylus tenuis]|uniref:Uncharacterized protein n=1 Tax=Parelaphostrongylus tenuis TaxID=148309 RepID=A0AAD5MSR8_PARTN|nr:hypothetical protein KIN20_010915 [Parelaphostrongylus tenuis]
MAVPVQEEVRGINHLHQELTTFFEFRDGEIYAHCVDLLLKRWQGCAYSNGAHSSHKSKPEVWRVTAHEHKTQDMDERV